MLVTVTAAMVFQVLGGAIMVVAIILFAMNRGSGENAIRVAGIEIQVSTPSVLMLILGAALFVFPYTAWFHEPTSPNTRSDQPARSAAPGTGSEDPNAPAMDSSRAAAPPIPSTGSANDQQTPEGSKIETQDGVQVRNQQSVGPATTPVPGFPEPGDRADWSIRIQACEATKDLGQTLLRAIRPWGFHVGPVGIFPHDPMPRLDVVYATDADKPFADALAGKLTAKLGTSVGTDEINIAEGEQKVMYVFAGGDGCPGGA